LHHCVRHCTQTQIKCYAFVMSHIHIFKVYIVVCFHEYIHDIIVTSHGGLAALKGIAPSTPISYVGSVAIFLRAQHPVIAQFVDTLIWLHPGKRYV